LVNDDEKHLVVMRGPRERLLQPQQLLNLEIRSVG